MSPRVFMMGEMHSLSWPPERASPEKRLTLTRLAMDTAVACIWSVREAIVHMWRRKCSDPFRIDARRNEFNSSHKKCLSVIKSYSSKGWQ